MIQISFSTIEVREPYSVVGFLAERLNLPEILNLKLDEDEGDRPGVV